MNRYIRKSFKRQLFCCFLGLTLVPMLTSGIILIQLSKIKINGDYQKRSMMQAQQVDECMDSLFRDIDTALDEIIGSDKLIAAIDEKDRWTRNRAYAQLYEVTAPYRQLAEFHIYNCNGECVYSTGNEENEKTMPVYWGVLKAAAQYPQKLTYRHPYVSDEENTLLYGAYMLGNEEQECTGYVVVQIKQENMENILSGIFNSQEGIAFLDSYWETVYSAGIAVKEDFGGVFREQLMEGKKLPKVYKGNSIAVLPLLDTGMYKVMIRPEIFSKDVLDTMYWIILFHAIFSVVLCITVSERISNSLTAPIMRINDAMRQMQQGKLETRIPIGREDELGQMSENFNMMANELTEYMEQKVQAQRQLDDSHIAMMQAQMNPHFLYNTLDTMKWLAKANHVPKIATMATGLARILRASISANQFITLKEELDLAAGYADIQKIRFDDRFELETTLPKELESCQVPKLIIQPLVENAIIHGLEDKESGQVRVNVSKKDDLLLIDVQDNGCGMKEEIITALNERRMEQLIGHIGLYNVDTIIRLHYGDEYGLYAYNVEQGGAGVTIRLPLKGEENV